MGKHHCSKWNQPGSHGGGGGGGGGGRIIDRCIILPPSSPQSTPVSEQTLGWFSDLFHTQKM